MSQTVIALMWGRATLDALGECPQVTRTTKVRTALRDFADLCTAEPAVEWETKTLPFLHGLPASSPERVPRAHFSELLQMASDLKVKAQNLAQGR